MKTIEIIVHCYAEKIPQFASLLTAQLSSLMHWRPAECQILVTIAMASETDDPLTTLVVKSFSRKLFMETDRVVLRGFAQGKDMLFRRAIGRNYCAHRTQADVVWFADCDYLFGPVCLDALAAAEFTGLVYPQEVQIHRAHHIGDAEIARIKPGELFTPDLTLFEAKREKFAIGGLQIVDGDSARKHGYLDGTKWQKPVDPAGGFQDTKEDKVYRQSMGGSKPIALQNLYRFRHSPSAFQSAEERLAQTAGKT